MCNETADAARLRAPRRRMSVRSARPAQPSRLALGVPSVVTTIVMFVGGLVVALGVGAQPAGAVVYQPQTVYVAGADDGFVDVVADRSGLLDWSHGSSFQAFTGMLDAAADTAGHVYVVSGSFVKRYGANGASPTNIYSGCPQAVAVDAAGHVYIADAFCNQVIKEYTSSGVFVRTVLNHPPQPYHLGGAAMALDAHGDLFIGDADGTVPAIAEVPAGADPNSAPLLIPLDDGIDPGPGAVSVDPAGDRLYIANSNGGVYVYALTAPSTWTAQTPITYSGFGETDGVIADAVGNIFVWDFSPKSGPCPGQGAHAIWEIAAGASTPRGSVCEGEQPGGFAISPAVLATVPGAPRIGVATRGNASAAVAFSPPLSNGGAPITSYTATCTSTNGGTTGTQTGPGSPIVVSSLTNGDTYTCKVRATNAVGTGAASAASNSVVPTVVPGQPRLVIASATPTNTTTGALAVGFSPPTTNGGSPITSYTATCVSSNGGATGTTSGPGSPLTVGSLTTAKTYTCTVKATNATGTGLASSPSGAVVVGSPAAPSNVKALPGATTTSTGPLSVSFTPGADNGGTTTSYTATCTSGNGGAAGSKSGPTSPLVVTGLTTAKTYSCTVKGTNARGAGVSSSPSAPVIVGSPAAPTGVTATQVAAGQLRVSFTPGASNGSSTTSYAATCASTNGGTSGAKSGSASPLTVTGLTPGKAYTCTVKGTNARGTGPASAPSAVVTA